MGRNWVHAAVAAESRFLIDLRLGPRTLEVAAAMVATVAACCPGEPPPLLLVDGHLPCPAAILQVFGVVRHGRRRHGRGRPKLPRLKPPPGLRVGVVNEMADARGRVFKVRRHALFGRLRDVRAAVRRLGLGLGTDVNTSHVERPNGTCRRCVGRLARRTRDVSRRRTPLRSSLSLWRDVYNWCRPHGSLAAGVTPAWRRGRGPCCGT